MDARATRLACGGVALGIAGGGRAADRRFGTSPVLTAAGALVAGAYLVGTFRQSSTLFGRASRPRPVVGQFALTFDDGPDPRFTSRVAGLLANRGHRATFFVLGRAVSEHPELAAQLITDEHEIANHGFDHSLLAFSTPRVVREQIATTQKAVQEATGRTPARLFRAPHGVRSPWLGATVESLGYRLCGWDGSVRDTDAPGTDVIAERVVQLLRPGTIVLLHDGDGSGRKASREQTVDALPAILDAAEERGLRSVPLSTLLDSGR
jgi:peptidoglycan/xylan/chitin deacetylase (PgdA/CDA1 family)